MTGDIGESNARQSEFMHKHQDEPNVAGPEIDDVWNLVAVRSFFRLFAIRTKGWYEAEGCDRHYDGGEWSGPAWSKNWENELQRTCDDVAKQFGVESHDLYDWIEHYEYHESHLWQDAMMKMTRRTT